MFGILDHYEPVRVAIRELDLRHPIATSISPDIRGGYRRRFTRRFLPGAHRVNILQRKVMRIMHRID